MNTETQTIVTSGTSNSAPLVTKTLILSEGDVETKRQEILDYFHDSFTLYESLFECLASDESYYRRANSLRQPLIFYYGHTSVFFINKLNVAKLIDERVDPQLESILAIGVDEMSWDDLNDDHYDWPTPDQVKGHREQTRAIVDQFIRECEFSLPIQADSPMWIVLMGIEHERIHLETSSILMRELPLDLVQKHPIWGNICRESNDAPPNELIKIKGGKVELGKSKTNPLYGWDNEYGYAAEEVGPFKASKYLVSNQEFLEFVDEAGYETEKYWTAEGWNWLDFSKAKHPVYWIKDESGYRLRTMLEVIDMPWDWPAEINYLEAKAFCNWKSEKTNRHFRMPTESEWHQMRLPLDTDQPYWKSAPGNINLEDEMSPCPVNRHEFHDGIFDLIGNVWQWTETPIDGYSGFEVHPIYDDFSAPAFDGKHNLFKGGCWISTGNYAIKDSRYAFRRHFFQYSGLRYIEAEPLPELEVNVYESDKMVSSYIDFHWGEPAAADLGIGNFPVSCIEIVKTCIGNQTFERTLDIGCATARSSFELAQFSNHVDAVDFSARLIEMPINLATSGRQKYLSRSEGELNEYREIRLDDFEGYDAVKHRIDFTQGDACNLIEKYDGYDLVYAGNLLDRLYDPAMFLECIKARIRAGGLLVLASPYNWLADHTPREKWLGGFKANTGENYSTLDGIRAALSPEFTLAQEPVDVPFVIQETKRKFQYGISELTIWKKD